MFLLDAPKSNFNYPIQPPLVVDLFATDQFHDIVVLKATIGLFFEQSFFLQQHRISNNTIRKL